MKTQATIQDLFHIFKGTAKDVINDCSCDDESFEDGMWQGYIWGAQLAIQMLSDTNWNVYAETFEKALELLDEEEDEGLTS